MALFTRFLSDAIKMSGDVGIMDENRAIRCTETRNVKEIFYLGGPTFQGDMRP